MDEKILTMARNICEAVGNCTSCGGDGLQWNDRGSACQSCGGTGLAVRYPSIIICEVYPVATELIQPKNPGIVSGSCPSIEVFYISEAEAEVNRQAVNINHEAENPNKYIQSGWYWHSIFPDGDTLPAAGPFDTEDEAVEDSQS